MGYKKQIGEVARPLPITPDDKPKPYTRPGFTVFCPDAIQAEQLKAALRENSDSVAARLIARVVSGRKEGRS